MPKLILSMDGLVLKEMALAKERITIGRKPHNDIQIDNLAISGEHAVITTILNDAFLEDRNSTNGTFVNGQPVKKHVLCSNDVIELGKYRIKYLADTPQAATSDLIDDSASRGSSSAAAVAAGEGSARDAEANPASLPPMPAVAAEKPLGTPVGFIQILSGTNAGRELALTKSLVTLGKPGQQVAVITRRPHGYFLTHVEGSSFPVLNGRALDSQAHHLSDHDIVEIAGVKMEFFFKPAV